MNPDPTIAGPLIGSLGGLFGSFVNNGFAMANADDTNSQNLKIARETNQVNKAIADQNLALQKDWNEYQKALQQQLFEREDTSYQRTAADMMAAGLNPLSMQGTNSAGQVVSTSAPQNNFQAQMSHPMQQASLAIDSMSSIVSGITSIMGQVEAIKTGQLQRDELQQKIDYQKLINENLSRELDHKVDINSYDIDLMPEKILTHALDWFQNGRIKNSFNFDLKTLKDMFTSDISTGIPFLDDLKKSLLEFGETKVESSVNKAKEKLEAKRKSKALIKSTNTKNSSHYQEKNKEYTQRYGGK